MSSRGFDLSTQRLDREIKALKRAVEALRSERRAAATTLTNGDLIIRGGGKLVVDGGDFLLLDTDGSTVFRLGPQTYGDRGVTIFREDGTPALAVRKPFANSTQATLVVFDRVGNRVLSEATFGDGHEEPYLPIPIQPASSTTGTTPTCGPHGWERTTESATFESLFRSQFRRENPYSRWEFALATSDTTTAAEVRVINANTGGVLIGFFQPAWVGSYAGGSTAWQTIAPPYGLSLGGFSYGSQAKLEVQARRTSGAGSVKVAVRLATGGPS